MRSTVYIFVFLFSNLVIAQVGIGTADPDPNAVLHVESQDKGVLFPMMNTAQRDAIAPASIPEGLILYNTQSKCLEFWNGKKWICSKDTKFTAPMRLDCDQVLINGIFVKNLTSPGQIFMHFEHDGVKDTSKHYFSDPILIKSTKGLRVHPTIRKIPFSGTDNALKYDVTVTPRDEGTGEFSISLSGQTCPVKIDVQKEENFTFDVSGILNEGGAIKLVPRITAIKNIAYSKVLWYIADDEKGLTNKKLLRRSFLEMDPGKGLPYYTPQAGHVDEPDSKYYVPYTSEEIALKRYPDEPVIYIPNNMAGKYLFYKAMMHQKESNMVFQKAALVGKIEPLPVGYVPSISQKGSIKDTGVQSIFTNTLEEFPLSQEVMEICSSTSLMKALYVIGNPKFKDSQVLLSDFLQIDKKFLYNLHHQGKPFWINRVASRFEPNVVGFNPWITGYLNDKLIIGDSKDSPKKLSVLCKISLDFEK